MISTFLSRYKTLPVLLLLVSVSFAFTPDDEKKIPKILTDQSQYTDIGNIGLTLTNFGMYGNGFIAYPNYNPSCEYPLGSGIEHMFAGGLWIGGFIKDSPQSVSRRGPYVTTGAIDINSLSSSRGGGFEFTNRQPDKLVQRSILYDSRFFSPDAISHQDFIADFSDTSKTFLNGEPIPEHEPLGVAIHQESYAWNFPFADFFVIMNYTIKNVSDKYLDSVYVGMWTDAVVRNIKVTPPRGTDFYSHGGNGYDDSMKIAYEFDVDGDPGLTDSYIGFAFLGSTPGLPENFISNQIDTLPSTNFSSWSHNSSEGNFFTPRTEPDRYSKMQGYFAVPNRYGKGINPADLKKGSNRSLLITHGYYSNIAPGDSINIVYAVVTAKKYGNENPALDTREQKTNLFNNTEWALRAYHGNDRNRNGIIEPEEDIFGDQKIHRYILPAPPTIPVVKVVPDRNKATIYWDKRAEASIDPISGKKDFAGYRVYRTQSGIDLNDKQDIRNSLVLLAQYDSAGTGGAGFNNGFRAVELDEPVKFPNDQTEYYYKVEVPDLLNGWQYLFAVTAFDKGDAENNLGSLESSSLANYKRIIPGTPETEDVDIQPGVYPNPYYGNAIWDGSSERLRKIYFFNLPAECEITIYTLAGDVVKRMNHSSTDAGGNIRWFEQYATDKKQQFAGGEHAWDLLTDNDQAVATGLYLFTVRNSKNGDIKKGKFLIIK
jgi:hypothetical protein